MLLKLGNTTVLNNLNIFEYTCLNMSKLMSIREAELGVSQGTLREDGKKENQNELKVVQDDTVWLY